MAAEWAYSLEDALACYESENHIKMFHDIVNNVGKWQVFLKLRVLFRNAGSSYYIVFNNFKPSLKCFATSD